MFSKQKENEQTKYVSQWPPRLKSDTQGLTVVSLLYCFGVKLREELGKAHGNGKGK